ncbi:MAG: Crp/Fnr family transcriptional regulator [Flavipsychrobacter sp.]|nr:Crp/Fnr family transcriptional regulator [Flavipsychrobacter sp.]
MTELEQYLRSYMNVTDEDMDIITSYFHVTTLEKGDYFLKSGRVCDKLSFHKSGLIRMYGEHGEKEVTQWISFKGNFVADLNGIVRDQPSRYNIRALTHSELYTISKKDYNNLGHVLPKWPALERALITRCFGFLETRIFALLSMSAEEQYQYLLDMNPDFNQVPLKYLASMMGMTPESLSRVRNKLAVT